MKEEVFPLDLNLTRKMRLKVNIINIQIHDLEEIPKKEDTDNQKTKIKGAVIKNISLQRIQINELKDKTNEKPIIKVHQ